jgi:hypothetical protein
MCYAKLLEMNSFFYLACLLKVGETQDLLSKLWQTLGDALRATPTVWQINLSSILFWQNEKKCSPTV